MKTLNYILFTTLFLSCNISHLPAQEIFSIGPGTCIGTTAQSLDKDYHLTLGWKMGLTTHIPVNKLVYLGPELYITNKGYHDLNYDAGWFGPVIESGSQLSLYYLELSFPVKFKLSESYYMQTGLQTGYLMHANFEAYSGGATYYDDAITSSLSKYELGLIAGMNWELKNGLGFSLIANIGLTDINKEEYVTLYADNEYNYGNPIEIDMNFGNNLALTGGIHYLFQVNKKKDYVKF